MSSPTSRELGQRNGVAIFRELAGDGALPPWEAIGDLAPALAEHIEHALGTVLGQPGLDLRTREIVTVALLAALGNAEQQLAFHAAAALRTGASPTEIVEAVTQVAIYAGIPRALNGLAVTRQVLESWQPDIA